MIPLLQVMLMLWFMLVSCVLLGVQPPASGEEPVRRLEAEKSKGFHSPYYLGIPDAVRKAERQQKFSLLVIPNNTGSPSDDLAVHEQRARRTVDQSLKSVGEQLGTIILVPIFPRPRKEWRIYTQALDRDTMLARQEELRRPDLQLLAMIDHARLYLKEQGFEIDPQVNMFGFSASGMFVNRFVFLHPHRVKAAAFGSPGGWPIVPIAQEQGKSLRYPIGTADWETVAGKSFDLKALRVVPMLLFMGDQDTNDSVIMRDSYELEDEKIIGSLFGGTPLARWPHTERLYRQNLPLAQLKLYPGVGHTVTKEIIAELLHFFRQSQGK